MLGDARPRRHGDLTGFVTLSMFVMASLASHTPGRDELRPLLLARE